MGPSIAIIAGGPGALFWLLVYIFFGSVTKFVEVTFALETRETLPNGKVVGGPIQYLRVVSTFLSRWYGSVIIFLFVGWCGLQSNTLAQIFAQEGVPEWYVGLILSAIVLTVISGGAKRVGQVASKLVPFMFFFYVLFAVLILFRDLGVLRAALTQVFTSIFVGMAPIGGFLGASVFQAMRHGVYRGIFITEAGLGTSSIPHAVADTKNPTDQGILAMYSTIAEAFLSILSGLLVLVTGVWLHGDFRSTLIYEAFKMNAPVLGQFVLLVSISLFVLTTVIGNSFNGRQSFSSLFGQRWLGVYTSCLLLVIFAGSIMEVHLVWEIMDTLLALIAIPNLIGITLLAFRKPEVLKTG